MASVNKAILLGNVGQEPRIRDMNGGKKVASFSLATSERWKDKSTGERMEKTDWHNIVVYNEGLVKVIEQYVKKGSKLYIEGALQTRKWTDQSGVEKYTTEVVLQAYGGQLVMLDGKEAAAPQEQYRQPAQAAQPAQSVAAELDDTIPF